MTGSVYAYAVLTPCQQSHPFEDRRIPFTGEPIKIGRAAAKLRASLDNAIFDCKVLSRNHAVTWYEDGKFYLKDTKSSNGTFVNNQRLSKSSEDSPAKEIFSGDIIQFGVEIVENAKKVTHGCIVTIARLYYPDGREAVARSDYETIYSHSTNSPANSMCSTVVSASASMNSQELFQLQQYIKEAAYREQLIENKLSQLQSLLCSTQDASENSWRALIDEDRLLSRIEMLEGQLLAYSKNSTEDKLREQITQMQEEKERYELSGKEALRRALQEKMEATQRLSDVERSLETTEEECCHLREACASANKEFRFLSDQHSEALNRVQTLSQQLEDAEKKYKTLEQRYTTEKLALESKLSEMSRQESILNAKMETVQADHDFAKEQLAALKVRSYLSPSPSDWNDKEENGNVTQFVSPSTAVEEFAPSSASTNANNVYQPAQPLLNECSSSNHAGLSEALKSAEIETQVCRKQLQNSSLELDKTKHKLLELNTELNKAKQDLANSNQRVSTLEQFISASDVRLHSVVEKATSDMIVQFEDAIYQKSRNEELLSFLREATQQLESRIKILLRKSIDLTNGNNDSPTILIPNHLSNGHCFESPSSNAPTSATAAPSTASAASSAVTPSSAGQGQPQETGVSGSGVDENARMVFQRQATKNAAEFAALKDECSNLRQRISTIENEIKSSRKENNRLSLEYKKLQESYYQLEDYKNSLELNEQSWRQQLESAKFETDSLRNLLNDSCNEAQERINELQKLHAQKTEEIDNMDLTENNNLNSGYNYVWDDVALQTRTITFCSAIPLFILLVALVLAFFPFFSRFTATNDTIND